MRTIQLLFEDGISLTLTRAVSEGVNEMIKALGMINNTKVVVKTGALCNWYCEGTFNEARGQINAAYLFKNFFSDLFQDNDDMYQSIIILKRDMYFEKDDYTIGYAVQDLCAVVSVFQFEKTIQGNKQLQADCVKTAIMQEFGHMFGVIDTNRFNIKHTNRWYCAAANCVMQQHQTVEDIVGYINTRISSERMVCKACCHRIKKEVLLPA